MKPPLARHTLPVPIRPSNSSAVSATRTSRIPHQRHRSPQPALVPAPVPIQRLPSYHNSRCFSSLPVPPYPFPLPRPRFSLYTNSYFTMSTAPLKSTEVASGDALAKQLADIIDVEVKDANSLAKTSPEDTANKIDQLFKNSVAANSDGAEDFLYTLWDVVVKSAVTIPATDQRLQQLVDVIKALQKKNTAEVEIWDAKVSVWKDLPMLGPALREAWNFKPEFDGKEDHTSLQKWISLNSFAARILGHQIQSSFNLGLWELRAGLEEKHPSEASRDLHLNTASEWLWHAGDELHRLSHTTGTLNQGDVDTTKTGSLVEAPTKGPSKDRWTFWKKRLGELSSEMSCAAKEEGLKERVDGVIKKMGTIEKGGK